MASKSTGDFIIRPEKSGNERWSIEKVVTSVKETARTGGRGLVRSPNLHQTQGDGVLKSPAEADCCINTTLHPPALASANMVVERRDSWIQIARNSFITLIDNDLVDFRCGRDTRWIALMCSILDASSGFLPQSCCILDTSSRSGDNLIATYHSYGSCTGLCDEQKRSRANLRERSDHDRSPFPFWQGRSW